MSAGKIPLIFGAHYKDTGVSIGNETIYGYSIATAHKNQGTLRDLEDIGDNKKICKIANSVRIDNIIIFDYLIKLLRMNGHKIKKMPLVKPLSPETNLEVKKLESSFVIEQVIDLRPYDKDHAMVIAKSLS